MMTSLVLTLIGADQPGLVEMLSQTVADHGGSWEHGRMARLGGHFVGILEVRIPGEHAEPLYGALEALELRGLKVVVHASRDPGMPDAVRLLKLELIGQDRPGIIRDISAALAAIEVNVVELETECTPAPMSGETLFKARALMHHRSDGSLAELRRTLEHLGDDLMVDISLDEES